MDGITEPSLALLPLLMYVSPIGGLLGYREVDNRETSEGLVDFLFSVLNQGLSHSDQDIWFHAGNLCCHQVSVLLTGKISCVQQLRTHTHTHS